MCCIAIVTHKRTQNAKLVYHCTPSLASSKALIRHLHPLFEVTYLTYFIMHLLKLIRKETGGDHQGKLCRERNPLCFEWPTQMINAISCYRLGKICCAISIPGSLQSVILKVRWVRVCLCRSEVMQCMHRLLHICVIMQMKM